MDYSKKTRVELITICKDKNIKGYSRKKKDDVIKLFSDSPPKNEIIIAPQFIRILTEAHYSKKGLLTGDV